MSESEAFPIPIPYSLYKYYLVSSLLYSFHQTMLTVHMTICLIINNNYSFTLFFFVFCFFFFASLSQEVGLLHGLLNHGVSCLFQRRIMESIKSFIFLY